jgi:hypothetical protein
MSMQYSVDTPLPLEVDASLELVVSHHVQPAVVSMQYLTDTTPIFGGDESPGLVDSHPIQPMVEEVVALMQISVYPALLVLVLYLLYHILSISSSIPSTQGSILLSP